MNEQSSDSRATRLGDIAESNPRHIWLEPTSRCNTRCIHCGHFYSRFGEDMDPDLYEKIAQSLLEDVTYADLIGYGEPLVARIFPRMFEDCTRRGIEISTTTNGILLRNEELVKTIVRNRVVLCVSMDGARAETFEFVRPFIKWPKMLEVLEGIKRQADAAGPEKRFRLRFNFAAMKANIGDLPDLVSLAHRVGASEIFILPLGGEEVFEKVRGQSLRDCPELASPALLEALRRAARHRIQIQVPPSFRSLLLDGIERGHGIKGKALRVYRRFVLGYLSIRRNGLGEVMHRLMHRPPLRAKAGLSYCTMPWRDSYFAADGSVFPCCVMGEKLGSMKEQPWEEIWNGSLYRNLRRTIHSWNPSAFCRFCPLPLGINGGDERQYARFFSRFRPEEVPLDSPTVTFQDGFHELEHKEDRTPSHRWMGSRGRLRLPARPGARFLRILIIPRAPVPQVNPGRCRINTLPEQPFDNTCDTLHFPVDQVRGPTLDLTLEMEQSHHVGEDPRALALAIRGLQFLYPGPRIGPR